MSFLQYPDTFNVPELQVWNNAAFDKGGSEDIGSLKGSLSNLGSGLVNQSLESDGSKENMNPHWLISPVSFKSTESVVVNPLRSRKVPAKLNNGVVKKEEKKRDEKKIDMEIAEVEKEISVLSSKLESLRLEKAECNVSSVAMRGRIVPAKFMEQKQSMTNLVTVKKNEDTQFSNAKAKLNRRGLTLGPMEIFSAMKIRQSTKQEITTPVQSIQSRRKSCFFKLQEIDEVKVTRERGKSLSLSPKSRKTVSKVIAPKPAATTVGSKSAVKKEDRVIASIQPKRLFKDGEKSETAKKPVKSRRIVASRYNQTAANQSNGNSTANDARKRSLPENDKQESKRNDKRRVFDERIVDSSKNQKIEGRVKKKWEIPSQVVVFRGEMEEESSPQSIKKMKNMLPEIKTNIYFAGSPRDSGPAKRVSELMGRKTYFTIEDGKEDSVCQALSFTEGDDGEEDRFIC